MKTLWEPAARATPCTVTHSIISAERQTAGKLTCLLSPFQSCCDGGSDNDGDDVESETAGLHYRRGEKTQITGAEITASLQRIQQTTPSASTPDKVPDLEDETSEHSDDDSNCTNNALVGWKYRDPTVILFQIAKLIFSIVFMESALERMRMRMRTSSKNERNETLEIDEDESSIVEPVPNILSK